VRNFRNSGEKPGQQLLMTACKSCSTAVRMRGIVTGEGTPSTCTGQRPGAGPCSAPRHAQSARQHGDRHVRYPRRGALLPPPRRSRFYVNSPSASSLGHNGNLTKHRAVAGRPVPQDLRHSHQLRFRGSAQRPGARAAGKSFQSPSRSCRHLCRVAGCIGAAVGPTRWWH